MSTARDEQSLTLSKVGEPRVQQDDERSDAWETLGLRAFLTADTRPSVVLDLHSPAGSSHVSFTNPSLDSAPNLNDILFATNDGVKSAFYDWALSSEPESKKHTFRGFSWSAVTLRRRWRIISGTESPLQRPPMGRGNSWERGLTEPHDSRRSRSFVQYCRDSSSSPPLKRKHGDIERQNSITFPPGHDWTAELNPVGLSPHVEMLRNFDWSKTPLGPLQTWSSRLRTIVNLLMCDPHPAVLFWGPELAGIYNEAYVPFVAGKHPKSLGEPYKETWKEIYSVPSVAKLVDGLWDAGYKSGKGTRQDHQLYHLLIDGQMVEKYFTLGMLPVLGDDGNVEAFYEPLTDVTKEHLSTRRQETIKRVSEDTAGVRNLNDFFSNMVAALEDNKYDIPFCMVYSVDSERHDDENKGGPPPVDKMDFSFAKMEGTVGVQLDDDGRPVTLLLQDDHFKSAFQKACRLGEFITFDIEERLALNLMLEPPDRGFGDTMKSLVFCPIEPTTQKTTAALLVLGVNTRAPLDLDHLSFIRSLSRTISASLASVMLLNIASRRTLEAARGERVAKGMLSVAPVGAYLISLEGEVLYANPTWYQLTDYNKFENEQSPMSWVQVIWPDDQESMQNQWALLLKERRRRSFEIRLKKEWKGTDPITGELIRGPMWVLAEAAVQTIDGADFITGCMTDISRQKWAEQGERLRREEAVELKRQQENFIDMTSHEMRNPLSAIFQSADGIISALSALQSAEFFASPLGKASIASPPGRASPSMGPSEDKIAYAMEAASTIALCAQHQKRIVDDVLVLSKVDANLLEVYPIDVQPQVLVEKSLRMFAAELASNDAHMDIRTERNFQEMEIEWVKLDPSRVLQVLINLCTNAIKFTVTGAIRSIRVTIGASRDPPESSQYGLQWLSAEGKGQDPTVRPDWGTGEQLYLSFAVHDTGRGMSEDEMRSLFQRFSQASPRTHTQYGGSGLGLFIAKLLTQLQGGQIGVTSTPGRGSTFAFYIKVRRTPTPQGYDTDMMEGLHRVATPHSVTIPIRSAGSTSSSQLDQVTMNVLIVEDNLVNQRVLKRQLQNLGWTVNVANNGQEAIDFLKVTKYWKGNESAGIPLTLVLMDIEMPVMNGTAATKEIRKLQKDGTISTHVPIIAITANARLEQVDVARSSGMDDVVSKPFRIPELVAKVEALIVEST